MSLPMAALQIRADILRVRIAALRAALPNGLGACEANVILLMMYELADEIAANLEMLADISGEVDRAGIDARR